jgi:hypothetical protein
MSDLSVFRFDIVRPLCYYLGKKEKRKEVVKVTYTIGIYKPETVVWGRVVPAHVFTVLARWEDGRARHTHSTLPWV